MSAIHHGFEKRNGRQCTIMIDHDEWFYVTSSTVGKGDNFSRKKGRSICAIRMNTIKTKAKAVRGSCLFLDQESLKKYLLDTYLFNSNKSSSDFVDSFIGELFNDRRLGIDGIKF